ncbi:MAG: DUF2804 domain-containing protein [Spirochaetaceae bacterium]|jgi:hypothetical protein|nr:DUF2804 domain-containing protein [Spirochaetaceae bacterium]
MAQHELDSLLPAVDENRRPVHFGWARAPLLSYDPLLCGGPRYRITESDRYIIFSPTHLMILEILDGGILGYIGISVVFLKDKRRSTQSYVIPFSLGSLELPPNSEKGSIRIQQKKGEINFAVMEGGARIIKLDIPKFGHHRHLWGVVVLSSEPSYQSIVTHMPWRREKKAFRYSRRSPWYTAEGVMQLSGTEIIFSRGSAWGIFDWNRGVRPRSDIRFWAAACGLSGERQIGFNVGYGSADSGFGTENAFFVDGKLHKLDQVTFHISPHNWLEPWRFTSNDNRLEMTFIPNQERFEHNRILIHSLRRRQVCGSFSGKVVLDSGEELEFQNLTGIAEQRKTRF